MIKKHLLVCFCAIAYLAEVDSQVCERKEAVTTEVVVTYQRSYITTYHGQCYYGCIKTKWSTSVERKRYPKQEWKTIKSCCAGYIRTDESSNDSDIVCEPICMPACKNGYCKKPAECACYTGYNPDPKDTHNCLPVCENACDHGVCVAPNACLCDYGYKRISENATCQPVCTEPCHNGTCTAPETCECLPGYRKSEKNICEPYCSNGCDNGVCTAPETCTCNPGYNFKEGPDSPKRCQPICSKPCDNGNCVAPETCKCWPSYKNENDTCIPECLNGWKLINGECVAQCEPRCGKGVCVSPNQCICYSGYHVDLFNHRNDRTVCAPTCTGCEDIFCVAPNVCKPPGADSLLPKPERYGYADDYDNYDYYYSEYEPTQKPRESDKKTSKYLDDAEIDTKESSSDKNTLSYTGRTEPDKGYFHPINNSSSTDMETTETYIYTKDYNSTSEATTENTLAKNPSSDQKSWIEQNWFSIFIPLLVIVTAASIMLLVWRWAPIVVFFKGRSYVVEGDPADNNASQPFEDIQISTVNEKETKSTQK